MWNRGLNQSAVTFLRAVEEEIAIKNAQQRWPAPTQSLIRLMVLLHVIVRFVICVNFWAPVGWLVHVDYFL